MQNSTNSYTPAPKEKALQFLRVFARLYVPENGCEADYNFSETHGVRPATAQELLN